MVYIIVFILVIFILYIGNFPGGPTGFAIAISYWITQKKDALKSVLLKKGILTRQSYGTWYPYGP